MKLRSVFFVFTGLVIEAASSLGRLEIVCYMLDSFIISNNRLPKSYILLGMRVTKKKNDECDKIQATTLKKNIGL